MDTAKARAVRLVSLVGMSAMFLNAGVAKIRTGGAGGSHKRLVKLLGVSENTAAMLVLAAGIWEAVATVALWYGMYKGSLDIFWYSLLALIIFTALATLLYKIPFLATDKWKTIQLFANVSLMFSFVYILFSADTDDLMPK